MGRNEKVNPSDAEDKENQRVANLMRTNWEIDSGLEEFGNIDVIVPSEFAIACLIVAVALFAFGFFGLSGSIGSLLNWATLVFAVVIVLTLLAVTWSTVRTRRELKLSAIEANKEIKVELIRWLAGRPSEAVVKLVIGDSDGSSDREEDADEAGISGAADADSPSAASATAVEGDAPDGQSGSSTEPPAQSGDSAVEPSRRSAT